MAKKPSVQTVAPSRTSLKKAAGTLSAEEEQALRLRSGVGLAGGDRLERKSADPAVLARLSQIELAAFQVLGQKVYGVGTKPAPRTTLAPASAKSKIIKALKKR